VDERILVVDDEEIVLTAVRKALREDNFTIDAVQSAKGALELLAANPYHLVIADLMMPVMDGLQLLQCLRDRGVKAEAIMITGYPTIQTALQAKRLRAFEYVTKPFTRQELRSAVLRAIRAGAVSAGAAKGATAESAHPPEAVENVYYIPEHAWARVEPDGKVRVGIARAFALVVGEVVGLRLPAKDDLLQQGRVCAVIQASDAVEHSLYSPLSGWVVEINQTVLEEPNLAARDSEYRGWLLRLVPRELDKEIANLSPA
jgi:CheY-like chemotaxis protein/glycine cleavage system H lipoate-binding protein